MEVRLKVEAMLYNKNNKVNLMNQKHLDQKLQALSLIL